MYLIVDSCWLGLFKSVICLYLDLISIYISRVLVSHYNLERSWFQGLLLSLFSYVACLYLSCGVSSDAKSVPRIWGRHRLVSELQVISQ